MSIWFLVNPPPPGRGFRRVVISRRVSGPTNNGENDCAHQVDDAADWVVLDTEAGVQDGEAPEELAAQQAHADDPGRTAEDGGDGEGAARGPEENLEQLVELPGQDEKVAKT